MTACHIDHRAIGSLNSLSSPRALRGLGTHRRLTNYILTRSAQPSISVTPWPCPVVTGPLAILAVGCLWGAIIGFALGGSVGAVFVLIGAIYGAPIGAIVGFIVGVPASIVLAALLLVLDRPVTNIERLPKHVAGGLAALIEALAASALTAITIALVADGELSNVPIGVAAMGAVVLLGAVATWLLRFAARDLVRAWARAWGFEAIR